MKDKQKKESFGRDLKQSYESPSILKLTTVYIKTGAIPNIQEISSQNQGHS
tara:strand:- start:164 stop:316 length:153 start_codon:yes stop_codon:yes gene_type:complete